MARKDRLGRWGEEYAARHVARHLGPVLARNWRSAAGEVDLVFADGEVAVVCEVKTRRSARRGHPAEVIDRNRLERLARAAELWLALHPEHPAARLDAIAILCEGGAVELRHLRGVVP